LPELPGNVLVTFMPGAVTLTFVLVSEKYARLPLSSTAPTDSTPW
jgi:hypothetical protein